MTGTGYLLENSDDDAGARLAALADVFDPPTFRHLEDLGVGPGWRCWEVGAGGPSVPRWLAARVGAGGRVVATDIDVSRLEAGGPVATPGSGALVEVLRHDVAADAPPGGPFDLVHARLVLVHVPDRDAALRAMVGALRPGGWLLVEDADPGLQPASSIDPQGPDDERANRIRAGFRALLAERGADLTYGRKLPALLRAAGLVDVAADAWFPVAVPGCIALEAATVRILGDRLVERGVVTADELRLHLEAVEAGRLDLSQPPMVAAWGRVPG